MLERLRLFGRPLVIILLAAAGLLAQPANAQDPRGSPELEQLLARGKHPYLRHADFSHEQLALRSVYERSGNALLWLANGELTKSGVQVLQTLRAADEYGLRPDDYEGTQLIYHAIDLVTDRSAPASRWAELDLGITLAALRMATHLHYGRVDPRVAGFNLNAPRAPFDAAAIVSELTRSADPATEFARAEPNFFHYQLTKRALQQYRLLAIQSELTDLPAFKGRSVKPGEPYEGAAALRRLLIALGDLPNDATTSDVELDATLTAGLQQFQGRHGLTPDGAMGRSTFAALTTPLKKRVQQLELTLERWRWLPEFTAPPIIVNIPQFRLFAFRSTQDRAADILQMDVIVGQVYPKLRTPVFMADMKYVVFRPYWDVPPSILRNEMLPEIRKNPAYLTKHNLEIVSATDSEGAALATSPETLGRLDSNALRLRQLPGDDNSLGLIKFMLPNSHNVYLHSTPAHRLFKEPRRAFSHGCIRVSDPVALAEHVLSNQTEAWSREQIEAAMQSTEPGANNRHVVLKKSIPVLIVYGTAIATENGQVLFFDDIYGHDAKLLQLLK